MYRGSRQNRLKGILIGHVWEDSRCPLLDPGRTLESRTAESSEGGRSAVRSWSQTRKREGLNLRGQQMPSPKPWKMIR